MKLLFVSGPYRGKVDANIIRARNAGIECWKRGWAVIVPHMNTAFMDVDGGIDNDTILAGDLEILRRCDAVLMLPGWMDSPGARVEYATARSAGKLVFMWPEVPKP